MKCELTFDAGRCCACSACMIGCIDQNDIDVAAGDVCYRKVWREEIEETHGKTVCEYHSVACMHCENAPCIDACPVGCIKRDAETGFTVYDNTNCIGCRKCSEACPYDAPKYRVSDGKMVKCDGCVDRVKHGLQPACVQACPFGALGLQKKEN